MRDSLNAQAIADREGPGVSIHAEFANVSGSRRAVGVFSLDDDAYVVVGHIDADGVVRITFPTDPRDDGFAQGHHSYRTSEFFAGFLDDYRYRATTGLLHYTSATPQSYDGGLGYVFVIASWRPMRFDQFQTDGQWDTFELADADYMNDPRPAIYELASLLAGENREAYTVKFARYTSSQSLYAGLPSTGAFGSSAYGSGFCSGYSSLGFFENSLSPSSYFGAIAEDALYGNTIDYRGSQYYYDSLRGCYQRYIPFAGFGTYRGPQIASQTPATPPTQAKPRTFDLDGHRSPPTPTPLPGYKLPVNDKPTGSGTAAAGNTPARVSPHYRDRGLITADDGSTTPIQRNPRIDARTGGSAGTESSRPSIQQMLNRHESNGSQGANGASGNSNDGWSRANARNGSNGGNNNGYNSSNNGSNNGASRQAPQSNNGSSVSTQRNVNPGADRSGPETRTAPAGRVESAPAPSYSPPRAAPSSPPPSPPPAPAPASSGSGAPIKP
ncbi:MAG: hypothetical protein ABI442_05820 [Gemmatimonadaceae bacterium]